MAKSSISRDIMIFNGEGFNKAKASILTEKFYEIKINGKTVFSVMMTPGFELELAAGLLFSHGIISHRFDFNDVKNDGSSVDFDVEGFEMSDMSPVHITTSSGLISHGRDGLPGENPGISSFDLSGADILKMVELLGSRQALYRETGASHGAGIFNRECETVSFFEDAGRHNALDKAIGDLLLRGELESCEYVFLTSRISYEMVRKAAGAGARLIAGISAPTSRAIEICQEAGITLIGKISGNGFRVYESGKCRFT